MRAYYFTIIYIIVIFYSHTKSFLSYCHIVTIVTQTPVCPRGRYTPLACRKPAISIRKNTFRFLQKIVSRPPEASKKKAFPFNRFLHLSPTCGFAFSAKSRIFVSADKRAGSPFFEPPHKKTGAIPLHFPAGIFPQT